MCKGIESNKRDELEGFFVRKKTHWDKRERSSQHNHVRDEEKIFRLKWFARPLDFPNNGRTLIMTTIGSACTVVW